MNKEFQAPDFYLIGLPKAGTTSLYEMLAQSPEIYDCSLKEPNFFLPDGITPAGIRTADAYSALYDPAREAGLKSLDASVAYSHAPEALRAILAVRPDARFVLCLRRPEKLAPSQYQQMRYVEVELCKTFDEAWQDRLENGAPKEGHYQFVRDYPRSATVGQILDRILAEVPRQSLHVIIFEEFLNEPQVEMEALCKFLNISPFPFKLNHSNPAKQPRFATMHRQILHNGSLFRTARAVLRHIPFIDTQKLAKLYFSKMVKPLGSAAKPSSSVDLAAFFFEEKKRVEELLGRDIPAWWTGTDSSET